MGVSYFYLLRTTTLSSSHLDDACFLPCTAPPQLIQLPGVTCTIKNSHGSLCLSPSFLGTQMGKDFARQTKSSQCSQPSCEAGIVIIIMALKLQIKKPKLRESHPFAGTHTQLPWLYQSLTRE